MQLIEIAMVRLEVVLLALVRCVGGFEALGQVRAFRLGSDGPGDLYLPLLVRLGQLFTIGHAPHRRTVIRTFFARRIAWGHCPVDGIEVRLDQRSEERRGGKEGVNTCRTRW